MSKSIEDWRRDCPGTRWRFAFALAAALFLARSAAAAETDGPCFLTPPVPVRLSDSGETGPAPDSDSFAAAAARGGLFQIPPEPSVAQVRTGSKKRFLAAAGEVVLLEVGPWAFDRYVSKEDFAFISTRTIHNNFRTGFQYDRDAFPVNQSSHPYHGSLFFDAARSNGYGFWESGAFALTGSLIWECCMENTAPSINDLVNTTLGGMVRGEVAHRMSAMVLDNTSTGAARLFREIGASILNPVGSLNRLLRGEVGREFENPPDRFPSAVVLSADLGYRHIGGGAVHPNQGILSLSLLYGNPFEGDLSRPFDSFYLGIDLNAPGGVLASRIEERGILKGWELTDRDDKIRHIFGFTQEYEYLNNESQVFGAQMFGAGLLSRYTLGKSLQGLTDASVIAIPLAGIKTTDFENPETGRNYDYAPGGGARVAARAYLAGREVLAAGYGVAWTRTVNGVSRNNTLQFFRAMARLPIAGPVGGGAAYYWYSRQTTYPGFFEPRKTQNEWRAFVNAVFPFPFR